MKGRRRRVDRKKREEKEERKDKKYISWWRSVLWGMHAVEIHEFGGGGGEGGKMFYLSS